MSRKVILSLVFSALGGVVFGQNQIRISQYMLHHSFVNPAATGNHSGINGAIFYRNQWTGLDGAPVTQGLSLNAPLKNDRHNVGFIALNDAIGVNRSLSIAGSYAFNAQLNEKGKLAFGLTAALDLKQSRLTEADPENPADPVFATDSRMIPMPNFRFGTYYFTEKYYAGFSIPNLLENKIVVNGNPEGKTSFNTRDLHFILHGGYSIKLNDQLDLNASALIKEASGAPMQVELNPQLLIRDKVGIGVGYRTSKDLLAMVNVKFAEQFTLGYAFDYSFAPLGRYSSGSHEIMFVYRKLSTQGNAKLSSPTY